MQRHIELTIQLKEEAGEVANIKVDVYEPESGNIKTIELPFSPDEHPEFDQMIGNELYSWFALWADEMEADAIAGTKDGRGDKISYPIEEQINACYMYLGMSRKDAGSMNETELEDAEAELAKHFEWVEHSAYAQLVPRHIATGDLVV